MKLLTHLAVSLPKMTSQLKELYFYFQTNNVIMIVTNVVVIVIFVISIAFSQQVPK